MFQFSWEVRHRTSHRLQKQLRFNYVISGSNWVPADNMLTTITADRYRAWLELVKAGNQNIIRLWGGGVFEPDLFYDLCDGEFPEKFSN